MSDQWDAVGWAERFHNAARHRSGPDLRRLRAEVFRTTVDAVQSRGYHVRGSRIDLDAGHYAELHRGTAYHRATDDLVVPEDRRRAFTTSVRAEKADCLEVADGLRSPDSVPAVLNMASRRNPGGGVLEGAGAQEENLFRRTNLLCSLYQFVDYGAEYDVPSSPTNDRYPIPRESGGIYSPPTTIFRSSESTGYAFLPDPFRAAFLTVPAISRPEVERRDGQVWLTEAMAQATQRKIRAIFRIAAHHEHADLVLSAFGCGAFRNPPHHIAPLFKETLNEEEFQGVFRRVVFAVIDDHNARRPDSPEGNFAPFASVFGE